MKELDIRRGGKNDSGREDKFSSELERAAERVTKSCISCVSHSASSPSSSGSSSTETILGLGARKSGIDLPNKTDSLLGFGAVTERDVGMCSSSEVFGVNGGCPTVSSLEEEAELEMDEAGEWFRLRKRIGMTLVAGVRVNVTADSSRGGEGKLKDFPPRHSLMSPDTER